MATESTVRKAPAQRAAPAADRCAKIEPLPGTPNLPGGYLFGFTDPTDPGQPCALDFATENDGRVGRRDGSYFALLRKDEFSYGLMRNVTLSFAIFSTYTRWKGVSVLRDGLVDEGVEIDRVNKGYFDGLSAELFVRLLSRAPGQPLAVSVAVEPRWFRVDFADNTGILAPGYGAEFKLLMDAVLAERVFAALNFNYGLGTQRYDIPGAQWTPFSGTNVSGALSAQLYAAENRAIEGIFLGVEARYRTAFAGYALDRMIGSAVNVGPTLAITFPGDRILNLAWSPQVAGWAKQPSVPGSLDLDNFERHEFRVKFGTPLIAGP